MVTLQSQQGNRSRSRSQSWGEEDEDIAKAIAASLEGGPLSKPHASL